MSELASSGQIRMSFVRWALVSVPATIFLGFLSGRVSNSGFGNPWYDALVKPAIQPPGWAFGVAWSVLYAMLGLALAMVLNARGNRYRGYAIALFAVSFVANLAWSPLFFAAHQVFAAFFLILFMLAFAIATTIAFDRVRKAAAWLMLPYLLWLSFAAILNWQTHTLNPDAETLAPAGPVTQIDV
jgi:translocator protein